MTPLQKKMQDLVDGMEQRLGQKYSGRKLSLMIGKSRNHLSQILNDGLVPAGETLLSISEAMGATDVERREIIMAAIRTKILNRCRDSFWLEHALDVADELNFELGLSTRHLRQAELYEAFEAARQAEMATWREQRSRDMDVRASEAEMGRED